MKVCSKCKAEKTLDCFRKHVRHADGLSYQCKDCEYAQAREYKSRPEVAARIKAHRAKPENRAKDREYTRAKLADPVELAKHRERSRKTRATPEGLTKARAANLRYAKTHPNGSYARTATDPLYRLVLNFRRLLNVSLKTKRMPKTSRAEAMLGCSFIALKDYLERRFAPGMSWDNFGEWEIDHIYPLSDAGDVASFERLNHHTNLQPLWAEYNRAKSNRTPAEWQEYIKINNINLEVKP